MREALDKRSESAPEFVQEAAYLVANSYVVQSKGFQRILFAAQLFGLVYCFACILLPIPLLVMSAAVLGILTFYDFYTQNNQQSDMVRYYLDELGVSVILIATMLAVRVFNQHIAPELPESSRLFFHGAVVFVPLIGSIRLSLRRKPEKPLLHNSTLSLDWLYKAARVLNDVFAILYIFTIGYSTENSFAAPPSYRLSLYIVTFLIFVLWIRLGQDALARDSHTRTPRDYEEQEAAQRAGSLRPEVQPGEPGYTVWATLNALLPAILAAPLAVNLLSWIAGRGFGAGLYSFALNFSTFVVAMVSWRFVRKINRELVELLQPEKKLKDLRVFTSSK